MIVRVTMIAWLGVRSRLGRSALTAISLFVGVLAIVIIQAGAGAARDAVVANAILTSGRAPTVAVSVGKGRQSFGRSDRLRAVLDRELSSVAGSAALVVDMGETSIAGDTVGLTLVKGDFRAIRPFPIVAGRWVSAGSDTVIPLAINEVASNKLELSTGESTTVRVSYVNQKATGLVVGVVTDGSKEPNAYAPLELDRPWVKELAYLTSAQILVHTSTKSGVAGLSDIVRVEYRRVFDNAAAPDINRMDTQESFGETLDTIGLVFTIVAGLSLLVGALGILNIGLATLKERSDELSLRRSFGATKLQVVAIIVLEGQIVALGAAVAALAVGLAGFANIASLLSNGVDISHQSFPIAAALAGVGASCLAAFAGSVAPAVRAARVPIASIMRV